MAFCTKDFALPSSFLAVPAAETVSMSEITAIVPVHGRWELTAQILEDLRAQSVPVKEIIIVDNASPDQTAKLAVAAGARLISMDENAGFARAVNRGINAAETEYVLIVNNDLRLPGDWLEKLLYVSKLGAWFAAGKLLSGTRPGEIDGTFDLISRGGCAWRGQHGEPDQEHNKAAMQMDFPSFTAGLFRRSLFTRVGPLEEKFGSYLEDVEFGLRCVEAGLWGMYVPDAVGIHLGSATRGTWHPETTRQIARNQLWIVARHFPRVSWAVLVSQVLFVALAFSNGAGWAALQGKWDGLTGFGHMRRKQPHVRADFLLRHEQEIAKLQGEPARDLFWRLYFKLT